MKKKADRNRWTRGDEKRLVAIGYQLTLLAKAENLSDQERVMALADQAGQLSHLTAQLASRQL